jgi:hypothetical protein
MMDERGEFLSEAIEHISNSVDPRVRDWYSEEQLVTNLRSSFAEELQRVDNLEFATGFAGVCPVDGAEPNDYRNVFVPFNAGVAFLGIRFKGLDVTKPFVDVIATSAPLTTKAEVGELRDIACHTYSVFQPYAVRFTNFSTRAAEAFEGLGYWEKKYVAGDIQTMRTLPKPENLDLVKLRGAADIGFFDEYARVYEALLRQHPQHVEYATSDDRDDFEFYLSEGMIFEIFIEGRWAGLVAGYRDIDACLAGFRIAENVLSEEFRSRGFGRGVQWRLAEALDPEIGVIFGTIHRENIGAYHAAVRSGRIDIGGFCWVETSLEDPFQRIKPRSAART